MISINSPLVGPPTGSLAAAIDALGKQNEEYLRELWRLCLLVGLDPAILAAQFHVETNGGTSFWWRNRLNPAGIGITGDPAQNAVSQDWATQSHAARGHLAHMLAYVDGNNLRWIPLGLPDDIEVYDQRFMAPIRAGYRAQTINDLTGKWATDPDYHTKIVAKHRAIFGAGTQQEGETVAELTFGKVPYPAVTERHLPVTNEWVKEGAPEIPEAVFWHRMIGTLWGTDSWFFGDHAATAYGIGVLAEDGADDDGRIIEWMSPESRYYGESSGPANAPYGDGAALIAKVGLAYNRVTKAIEISGRTYGVPLSEKARESIVNLTAYWADQKRIPWFDFPMIKDESRSFVCWHQEITGPAYKACPGSVVMAETSALIARVKSVLQKAQSNITAPKPPVYALPVLPDWWEEAVAESWPSDAKDGDLTYRVARRKAEAIAETVRRSQPSGKAARSGPNVAVREKVMVERILTGNDGKQYLATNDGHFVLAAKFTPAIAVKAR